MSFLEVLSIVLPVIAFVVFFSILALNFYLKIRRKFPVKVNCWFCNEWTTVAYKLQNSWNCPFCEQYNGFNEDGGYNKLIPAQHDELMNKQPPSSRIKSPTPDNGLCNSCNNNQRLKVHQLAVFSPIDENKYDEEIELYRKQLERAYRLCPQCEVHVKRTLSKQKSILLGERLSHLRRKGLTYLDLNLSQPGISKTAKHHIFLTAITYTTAILATVRLLQILNSFEAFQPRVELPSTLVPYLAIARDIFLVIYNFICTISDYFLHVQMVFFETYLSGSTKFLKEFIPKSVFESFANVSLMQANFNRVVILTSTGVFLQLVLLIFKNKIGITDVTKCAMWILLMYIDYMQAMEISFMDTSFKAIEMFLCLLLIAIPSSTKTKPHRTKIVKKNILNPTDLSDDEEVQPPTTKQQNKLNSTFESIRSNTPFDNSATSTVKLFNLPLKKNDFEVNHTFGQQPIFENPLNVSYFKYSQPTYRSANLSNNSSIFSKCGMNESFNNSLFTLNDSVNEHVGFRETELDLNKGLSDLHLSSSPQLSKRSVSEIPPVFRVSSPRPKPVLSPPRLRNVTQSSWVAGGYWKNSNEFLNNTGTFSNLSRSSSQSSGFGSQTSSQQHPSENIFNSLPPSTNNSVCGEFDKFSVFSEPAYKPNASRNTSLYYNNRISSNGRHDQHLYIPTKSVIDYKMYSCVSQKPNGISNGWNNFSRTSSPDFTTQSVLNHSFNAPTLNNSYTPQSSTFVENNRPPSVLSTSSQNPSPRSTVLEKWRTQYNLESC